MPIPTKSHLSAARRLLERERGHAETADWAAAAGRVYEALFRQLAPVIGSAGVRALIARCLKLDRTASSCLAKVRLPAEPCEHDLRVAQEIVEALAVLEPARQLEIATALYATFIALLTTFIGERLTWQIVQITFLEDDGTASKERE